jgi:methylmalonyl-CoA mutase N-terminal domain/subunit
LSDRPTKDDWRALADKEVKGRDLAWHVPEGFAIEPLYTANDAPLASPGLPGFAPFTRGVKASMYAGRPWTIRQYAGFSTAEDSNAFYRHICFRMHTLWEKLDSCSPWRMESSKYWKHQRKSKPSKATSSTMN